MTHDFLPDRDPVRWTPPEGFPKRMKPLDMFFQLAAGGGHVYVMPANVNPVKEETWKKSETDVAASRCLYVGSASGSEVREGSCMVSGARSSSRVFKLVNTSVADEYGVRSVWNGCWQPEVGEDDAETETAADGVAVISVSNASGCGAVLQRWRIEPVDPNVIVGKSS